ncbi:MAG TPA: PTS sugar transporter subunit IIA [Candidatus Eisenbacteria bacterium]
MPYVSAAATEPTSVVAPHLRPELFISELRSRKKSSVLEEMVATLALARVTRHPDAVLDVLRRREALGSTGIGRGIAVPHARATMVSERALVVARSKKGVAFDAMDGNPSHLLFLIVAPPIERDPIYLKLVAEIVKAVRLARTRQRILEAPGFDAVRDTLVQAL